MILWIRYVLGFVLLPLVAVMGRRARKTIQVLPEADGTRVGIVGEGEPKVRIVCLGE